MSEQKSSKLLVIILVITIVVVLAIASFFAYFMFFNKNTNSSTENKKPKKVEETTMELKEFVVNLADKDQKYIKTTLNLAYENTKLEKEITKKVPQIRNIIIRVLRDKKATDFDGSGLDKVNKEIIAQINTILEDGKITSIYVQEIIIQ